MARRGNRNTLEALLDRLEPNTRKAFEDVIYDIRRNIDLQTLTARLEARDIEGAIRALNIDDAAFRPLEAALVEAFNTGGLATVNRMPPLRLETGERAVIRFDARNLVGEGILRQQSGTLIREIKADALFGARSYLSDALSRGENPTTTALDLAGRINRASGRREGGLIGLTSSQVDTARRFALELATGDANALSRKLRDPRFDRTIRNAIKEGRGLTSAEAVPMYRAYLNRALRWRAETIARTETMTALSQAQDEAFRQNIEAGKIDPSAVTSTWYATGDKRTRDTHREMSGQKVAWGELFISPSGARLRYPGDPRAPASERINCRCARSIDVDYLKQFR
jgi:hypothetical protein